MRVLPIAVGLLLVSATGAAGQSLFILQGERAAQGSIGWSVGPFSNGVETEGSVSIDGRWDVGFGVNRYAVDLGGADDTTFTEYTPSIRYFLLKEADDAAPISLAAHAQYFRDYFGGDDEGWYALVGTQIYKKFDLGEGLAVYPFIGFSLAAESYTFGGGDPERAVYLTRQLGVHGQMAFGARGWLRLTVEEHAFRRETYRAVRVSYIRQF